MLEGQTSEDEFDQLRPDDFTEWNEYSADDYVDVDGFWPPDHKIRDAIHDRFNPSFAIRMICLGIKKLVILFFKLSWFVVSRTVRKLYRLIRKKKPAYLAEVIEPYVPEKAA